MLREGNRWGGLRVRFLLSGSLLLALVGCADLQYTSSYPVLPETTRHAFAYVFGGAGTFGNASGPLAVPTEPVGWADPAPPAEADNRPVAWYGPIVMNTQEQLRQAFEELQRGTFLKPEARG